jgi:hypothetical protein
MDFNARAGLRGVESLESRGGLELLEGLAGVRDELPAAFDDPNGYRSDSATPRERRLSDASQGTTDRLRVRDDDRCA